VVVLEVAGTTSIDVHLNGPLVDTITLDGTPQTTEINLGTFEDGTNTAQIRGAQPG
jgi:hypothetical protein